MADSDKRVFREREWLLGLLSLIVLGVCLTFTLSYTYAAPYPGIDHDETLRVYALSNCQGRELWCEAVAGRVLPGDVLLQLGDLTKETYEGNLVVVPFEGFQPGDRLPLRLLRAGRTVEAEWTMPPVTLDDRLLRFSGTLIFLPFWLAGTAVLLFLRPRDDRWLALILVFYLTAVWLVAGSVSFTRIAYSSIVLGAVTWAMVAAYVHLHLIVPSPLIHQQMRWPFISLYAIAGVLTGLEVFQVLPPSLYLLGLLVGVGASLGLLFYRWLRGSPAERLATRWLLVGIALAFGPGVILWAVPTLTGARLASFWLSAISALSLPAMPLFYTYALYRRQSGNLEFRISRLLSNYSFLLVYVTAFTLVYVLGIRWIRASTESIFLGLVLSAVFVAAAPVLRSAYQRAFDRLAYGTRHNPDELLRYFAAQIPTVADRQALVQLLRDAVAPSLLIRESALAVFTRGQPATVIYHQGVEPTSLPQEHGVLDALLEQAGSYRPEPDRDQSPLAWVRVAIPLEVREQPIGIWLFGRRDPDDFYPRHDIDLLSALANQVALALANADLFEEARQRAAQQSALNAVISAAAAAPELTDLLKVALRETLNALGLERGVAWLDNPPLVEHSGLPELYGETPISRVFIGTRNLTSPLIVQDWEQRLARSPEPAHVAVPLDLGVRASLAVPLRREGRTMGGLILASGFPRAWSEGEVALADAIGSQLGGAVERLKLIEQIRRQARQLELILETVQEGIVTLDGDLRIIHANPTAKRYLDLLAGVEEGEKLSVLGGRPIGGLLETRSDGLPHELRIVNGEERTYEVLATSMSGEEENPGWTVLLRDVTEVRRVQNRVHQQDRLAAVGQLAAGIAHDFNNIMNAIILFSEMLLDEPDLTPKGSERLSVVIEQAHRATTLTRQILDFGRQTIMDMIPIDLIPFLKEFMKLLERTLPESIQLDLEYAGDGEMIRVDPARFQQVFMNLALNSRDAMREGGWLRFEVDRWRVRPGQTSPFRGMPKGDWVRIKITDSGQGITPENLPHIFEPFFTTKAPGQGTGLGLAQVYGIIKQHNGYIDVVSRVGEGTTFVLYLPALDIAVAEEVRSWERPAPLRGGPETILVVEDEPATREAVCEILQSLNYDVLMAENGAQALKVFEAQPEEIDIVISDMVMPELGGVDLYHQLKERYPELRMILMTGYPLGRNTRMLLDREQVVWVQKPLNSETLARLVRQALNGETA